MTAEKRHVKVTLFTRRHRIEGEVVLMKGERVEDKLNTEGRLFEVILDARVYELDEGRLVNEAPYVAVNKREVSMLVPFDDDPPPT